MKKINFKRIEELEGDASTVQEELVFTKEEKDHHEKVRRQVEKLHMLVRDKAAADGEKIAANNQLMRLMPELIENKYLVRIEKKIDKMEAQRRKMKVSALSFNTYYEFALERIPQIMSEKKIAFDIDNFAAILEQFYRGGELEQTLNNDVDDSLFECVGREVYRGELSDMASELCKGSLSQRWWHKGFCLGFALQGKRRHCRQELREDGLAIAVLLLLLFLPTVLFEISLDMQPLCESCMRYEV